MTNSITVNLPKLYAKQYDALCDPARICCIESTTKAGKTIGSVVWQIGEILKASPGTEHWWVAPVYPQADMAYRLAWSLVRVQPGFKQSLSDRTIICPGDRRWSFRSADKPDNLYGSAVHSVVLDEASRMKDDAVDAVYSTTTATRGRMRLIGNVRGRSNRHYQWSRRGESGEPGFAYHRITADDAIAAWLWDENDLDMARRSLPANVFRELYYCEPSDDGGNPFGIDSIANCIAPASGDPPRVWGLDIARKRDYTVLIGLDSHRRVAALHRWHGLPYSRIVESVRSIVGTASKAVVFYDATGVGDPVGEQLTQARIANEPFIFSNTSKQGLMVGLAMAIQQGRTTVLDGPHKAELESFEYTMRAGRVFYNGGASSHDDCVCAHALAWHGAEALGIRPDIRKIITSPANGTPMKAATW